MALPSRPSSAAYSSAVSALFSSIPSVRFLTRKSRRARKPPGITPLEATIVALGGTVGTGNIVGVGAAIAAGGPGALFWMWVCGFLAMAIKYCEVVASVAYRQKAEDGSYRSGPYMYIKDGLRSKPLAAIFGVLMLVTISIICSVHASAITSNLAAIGVSHYITCGILAVFVVLIIFGGMKELVKIANVMVPFMCVFYIICALIVVFANIGSIGAVFASIFKGAFTGQAATAALPGAQYPPPSATVWPAAFSPMTPVSAFPRRCSHRQSPLTILRSRECGLSWKPSSTRLSSAH